MNEGKKFNKDLDVKERAKKTGEAILKKYNIINIRKWINAIMQNDEISTNKELRDLFEQNGINDITITKILSQREKALNNINFEIEL